jgi:hypothetical protein
LLSTTRAFTSIATCNGWPSTSAYRKARLLGSDGVYTRPSRGRGTKLSIAQEHLMNLAGCVNRSAIGNKTNGKLAYTENAEDVSSSATDSPEHDSQDSSNATV